MPEISAPKMETIRVARSEYKYQVLASEMPAIREWLLRYCVSDVNSKAGDWYAIRSLYLDSSTFRLYQDAREKLPFRLKLRARAYGDADGGVKLEVKRRVREHIVKTSATVKPAEWLAARARGLSGFHEIGKPSMAEFLQLAETARATPRMLVYYERQAFSSTVDDYVRVTFDRHMKCQPMNRWDLHGDGRAWIPLDAPRTFGEWESAYVMEIKFVDSPPCWLRDLVLRFGLERRGFSKYCRAIERGILQQEAVWDVLPGTGARLWSVA